MRRGAGSTPTARTLCSSAMPGRATAMSAARPRWATRPPDGGGGGGAGAGDRHRALVRGVHQCPWWVSRLDRAGFAASRRWPAVGQPLPGGDHPRHGARPARVADHLGVAPLARDRRRLDGRHAGARVGDHLSRAGGGDRGDRLLHAIHRATDRVGCDRAPGDKARPEVARRRLLRRGRQRRAVGGAGRCPPGGAGDISQRQRVHRPFRARPGRRRDAPRQPRPVAALRGRALPRVSRRQVGAPLRCQQLSDHR